MKYLKYFFANKTMVLMCFAYVILLGSLEMWLNNYNDYYNFTTEIHRELNKYWIWIVVSYVYYFDMNRNMVSRLIINGGKRDIIWINKLIAILIVLSLTSVISAVIRTKSVLEINLLQDLIYDIMRRMVLGVVVNSIMSLGCMIINNISVIVMVLYIYLSPWMNMVLVNQCSNSNNILLKNNPLYLAIKLYNNKTCEYEDIIIVLVFFISLWCVSLFMFRRKEFRGC